MNKDYLFLKNFYTLLEAGYSIEETLMISKQIFHHVSIDDMLLKLHEGMALDEILLHSDFPKTFKEYFQFYKNKNCLSVAISKSLDVCLSKENYENQLKSKLTYPIVLIVFLFLFSIFVVFVLLPNVNQLFVSFQIERSLPMKILFGFFYLFPLLIFILGIILIVMIVELIHALNHKQYKVIEKYLKFPFISSFLQKYFSLKFAVYYQELLDEEMDSVSIIRLLNDQMNESDLKIMLYEINNRLYEGETLEEILKDFDYFDELFISFFEMYIKNPSEHQSLQHYIQMTYQQIDLWIATFLKYLIPSIYVFVAVFVISIYISIIIPMMNIISDI